MPNRALKDEAGRYSGVLVADGGEAELTVKEGGTAARADELFWTGAGGALFALAEK